MAVPKLRFKEFADEWKKLKFKNLAISFEYGMNAPAKEYDGLSKYIRITDIDDKTHRYIGTAPVSPDAELDDKYIVSKDDILFARTGASTGKSYLYSKSDGLLYFAGFLIRMSVSKNYDSRFVFNQTLTTNYEKWIGVTSMRSGQPGINSQEYASYEAFYPTLPEQQKIADFLSLLDSKIALQEKKLALLKDYKRGVESITNKSIESSKPVPLSEMLIEVSKKSKTLNEYPIISSTVQGLFWQSDYFNREIASKDNIGYKILKKNQIVLSPQNLWMGNINYNSTMEIGLVSPSYKIFEVNKKYYAPFIGFIMKSDKAFFEYKLSSEQGASIVRRNLNIELFYEITFNVPSYEKQIEIISMLNSFDKKLNAESKLLTSMQHLKQALLQRMFI